MPPQQNQTVFIEEQQMTAGAHSSGLGISGMVRFLVNKGWARDESQANMILVGIAGGAILIAIGSYWWGFSTPSGPTSAEQQRILERMQQGGIPGSDSAGAPGPTMTTPGVQDAPPQNTQTAPQNEDFDPDLYQRSN